MAHSPICSVKRKVVVVANVVRQINVATEELQSDATPHFCCQPFYMKFTLPLAQKQLIKKLLKKVALFNVDLKLV